MSKQAPQILQVTVTAMGVQEFTIQFSYLKRYFQNQGYNRTLKHGLPSCNDTFKFYGIHCRKKTKIKCQNTLTTADRSVELWFHALSCFSANSIWKQKTLDFLGIKTGILAIVQKYYNLRNTTLESCSQWKNYFIRFESSLQKNSLPQWKKRICFPKFRLPSAVINILTLCKRLPAFLHSPCLQSSCISSPWL